MAFTPVYITIDDVKQWLYGKVKFGLDPETTITDEFLSTLIAYGEDEVLNDINRFYVVPLIGLDGGDFTTLPQYTQGFLSKLFTFKSVLLVLEEEFGRNSANINRNYYDQIDKDYNRQMNKIYARDSKTAAFRAVLPGLQINNNTYTGITWAVRPTTIGILPCGDNVGYAIQQTVKPARSLWTFNNVGGANGCTTQCE